MYHRVLPEPSPEGVSVEQFRRQVYYLRRRYDEILSGADLERYLRGEGERRGRRFAAIMFDDGFLDNHLYATPVLREVGVPAILALSTELMAPEPRHAPPDVDAATMASAKAYRRAIYDDDHAAFLSPTEVRAMHRSGLWSIQAHGHTHRMHLLRMTQREPRLRGGDEPHWSLRHALGREPGEGELAGVEVELVSALAAPRREAEESNLHGVHRLESESAFRERVVRDLRRCGDVIEGVTGDRPTMLCWPWGHWSQVSVAAATQAGFGITFGTQKGGIPSPETRRADTPLPRIGVGSRWGRFVRNVEVYRRPWAAGTYGMFRRGDTGERQ